MAGACIGRTRAISLTRSWHEHTNLYLAIIGPSGIGKTPTTNTVFKPVRDIEEQWYSEYVVSQKSDTPAPYRQLIVDDATPEALGCAFEDNPRGILWNRDELAGLFQDMDKYTKSEGGTMSRLMSAYDSNPWVINRADKLKNKRIPHATLSIFGTIQPKALTEIFTTREIDVGFVPRFLFVMVEQDQPALWNEKEVSHETEASLEKLVTALLNYEFDESGKPIVVKLSTDAKTTFSEWHDKVQCESWMDVDAEHMQTIAKKLHAQCLRLALILHCMEAVAGGRSEQESITKETMERAIRLAEYFKYEKYAVMQLILTQQTQSLPPIVKHTAAAIVQLEGEIDRAMLATAHITDVVNQSLDERFQVKPEAVGKAATELGLAHKQMPDGKRRGIIVQPEDIERLKILLETLSKPSEPSNQDDE